jgi:hypothetical protein
LDHPQNPEVCPSLLFFLSHSFSPQSWAATLPKNLHNNISLLPKQQHMSFLRAGQQYLHFLYVLDSSNSRTKTAWAARLTSTPAAAPKQRSTYKIAPPSSTPRQTTHARTAATPKTMQQFFAPKAGQNSRHMDSSSCTSSNSQRPAPNCPRQGQHTQQTHTRTSRFFLFLVSC